MFHAYVQKFDVTGTRMGVNSQSYCYQSHAVKLISMVSDLYTVLGIWFGYNHHVFWIVFWASNYTISSECRFSSVFLTADFWFWSCFCTSSEPFMCLFQSNTTIGTTHVYESEILWPRSCDCPEDWCSTIFPVHDSPIALYLNNFIDFCIRNCK